MKARVVYTLIVLIFTCMFDSAMAQTNDTTAGYVIQNESQLLKKSPSPNKGKGEIMGCSFFDDLKDFKISFRKRVLQHGASLGRHIQKRDEIYYVVSGEGIIRINDVPTPVRHGDAILTMKGSSHELIQTSEEDLVILVVFEKTL